MNKNKKVNAGLKCLGEIKKLQAQIDATDSIKLHRTIKKLYTAYVHVLSLIDHETFGPKTGKRRMHLSIYKKASQ
jgi:hypothetical protein